jgi:drug/metabolite transporter (DMT)-like permease
MGNPWILWALLSAFMTASNDALTKKVLVTHNEYLIAWLRLLWALPFLVASFVFIRIPNIDSVFFLAFFAALPLEVTATVLYVKALKLSPLSLAVPFLSLTPVFLIVVPYLILGETVSPAGVIGVLMIAFGGYALNIKETRKGILAPFMAIKRERGSLYMIVVALIFSVTATLGKLAIQHSSPVFFGVVYYSTLAIAMTPIALFKNREKYRVWPRNSAIKASILPGLCHAIGIFAHMIAISLTQVAYMISVKRLSLLMGVLYGYLLFKEENIRERFAGTLLMIIGFAMIALFH